MKKSWVLLELMLKSGRIWKQKIHHQLSYHFRRAANGEKRGSWFPRLLWRRQESLPPGRSTYLFDSPGNASQNTFISTGLLQRWEIYKRVWKQRTPWTWWIFSRPKKTRTFLRGTNTHTLRLIQVQNPLPTSLFFPHRTTQTGMRLWFCFLRQRKCWRKNKLKTSMREGMSPEWSCFSWPPNNNVHDDHNNKNGFIVFTFFPEQLASHARCSTNVGVDYGDLQDGRIRGSDESGNKDLIKEKHAPGHTWTTFGD